MRLRERCQRHEPQHREDSAANASQAIQTGADNKTGECAERDNETKTLEGLEASYSEIDSESDEENESEYDGDAASDASSERSTRVVSRRVDKDTDAKELLDTLQTSVEENITPTDAQEKLQQAVTQVCNTLVQQISNAGAQAAQTHQQDLSERLEVCEKGLASLQSGGGHICQEAGTELYSVPFDVNEAIQHCRDDLSTSYEEFQILENNVHNRFVKLEQSVTDRLQQLEKRMSGKITLMESGFNSHIARMEQDYNNRFVLLARDSCERKRKRTG
ncbi:hypothetical protein ACHAPJ_007445 [Fusarium lateritium]